MRELTDVALFVEYLQSAPLRSSEIEPGRGYSPYRSLEYDCACGRRHELKKNQHGYLVAPAPILLVNDPTFIRVSPEIFLGKNQVLITCSDLKGLVCVSVEKRLFDQYAKVVYFISYATLNSASNGFGLLFESERDVFDFNQIGQHRLEYPTKNYSTRLEMEEALLAEPSENISEVGRFVPQLESEYFDCPCGSKHAMGGIRSDYSLVQYGTVVTVPLLAVYKDLNSRMVKCVLYRCPERYTMIGWRPSRPALWSAKIAPITKENRSSSRLPEKIFNVLENHSFMVEVHKRAFDHEGSGS